MAPKKVSRPQAKPKAEEKKGKSKAARWAQSQLNMLAAQCKSGPAWLEKPHSFHQAKLEKLLERLDGDPSEELPKEFVEAVDYYTSQVAQSPDITEEEFYNDGEIYAEVLAVAVVETLAPYVRAPCTEEAAAAAAELRAWSTVTPQGLDKFKKLITQHAASAEVQEACLQRIGTWLAEASVAVADNLMPSVLTPFVVSSMTRFTRDIGVQSAGCGAIRRIISMEEGIGIVVRAGAMALIIDALKACILDVGVCKRVASIVYEIVNKTNPASPEMAAIVATKAYDVFAQVLLHHPGDHQLEKALRVSMPHIR